MNNNEDYKKLLKEVEDIKRERGLFGMSKSFTKGLVIGLGFTSLMAIAATITKPFTFTSGTPISSTEVNANFDTIYNQINSSTLGFSARYSTDPNVSCSTGGVSQVLSNIDTIDVTDGSYSGGTYTATATGGYLFAYKLPFLSGSSNPIHVLKVNGAAVDSIYGYSGVIPVYLQLGQTFQLHLGCDNKGGATMVLDSTKAFVSLKKF